MNLTKEQRQKIAIEELNDENLIALSQAHMLKAASMCIDSGAIEFESSTVGDIKGETYKIKCEITWEKESE